MSDIEKFIMEHRDSLGNDEPDSGHFNRFQQRMKRNGHRNNSFNFRHMLQIAASIAIIIASGVVIVKSSKNSSKMAENTVVEEFSETRSYYIQQVNERYDDISGYSFRSEGEKEILLKELSVMDEHYRNLLSEYNANPGDERVLNSLIQHYQVKVQVMDQIIDQLKQINNENISNDEKTSI